eukprot:scaffold135711_cov77-Cyclotella_meneghiniana.AAC.1
MVTENELLYLDLPCVTIQYSYYDTLLQPSCCDMLLLTQERAALRVIVRVWPPPSIARRLFPIGQRF